VQLCRFSFSTVVVSLLLHTGWGSACISQADKVSVPVAAQLASWLQSWLGQEATSWLRGDLRGHSRRPRLEAGAGAASSLSAYYRAYSAGWAASTQPLGLAVHLPKALTARLSPHGRQLALGLRAPLVCEAKLAQLTLRAQ
jgi:hypothetical protein